VSQKCLVRDREGGEGEEVDQRNGASIIPITGRRGADAKENRSRQVQTVSLQLARKFVGVLVVYQGINNRNCSTRQEHLHGYCKTRQTAQYGSHDKSRPVGMNTSTYLQASYSREDGPKIPRYFPIWAPLREQQLLTPLAHLLTPSANPRSHSFHLLVIRILSTATVSAGGPLCGQRGDCQAVHTKWQGHHNCIGVALFQVPAVTGIRQSEISKPEGWM
jgi:hypothetical protein